MNQADLARKELKEAQEFESELQKIAGQYESFRAWCEHPITKTLKEVFDTRHKQYSERITQKKCIDWNDYLRSGDMVSFYETMQKFCEGFEAVGQAVIARLNKQNGNE